jgi:RND family efflux transporter MFP subunit
MNIKNKKKLLYILSTFILIVFILRIVQAKINLSPEQEPTKTKINYLNINDYQSEGAYIYTTGKLESLKQLDIKSELSAKIKKINFSIGDKVKKGQVILELDNSTLAAQLSQAQASLNQRIAGASNEDIQIYQTIVDTAKADLEKTKSDNEQMISSYEIALQVAKNNLSLGGETLIDTLHSVQPILTKSLIETDNILGIDNELANDNFEDVLSVLDSSNLDKTKTSYLQAKKSKKEFDDLVINLNTNSLETEINIVKNKAKESLKLMETHLFNMQQVLDSTVPIGNLTQTSLNTMKTTISTLSSTINMIDASLTNAAQGQNESGEALNSYKIAHEKAKQDLENAKITTENILKIKEATYNQALANLEKIKANPRDVDLAPLQAVVSQSTVIYNKSVITAPFDGIISSIPYRTGDLITAGQIVASIVNQEGLQVKAHINQKERNLVSEGSEVLIEDIYHGTINNISPSIDSITKKIELIIAITDENAKKLTIGQYVNAKIFIDNTKNNQTFIIPLAAVKVYQDRKVVFFVDENNIIQEKEIKTGNILGDNIEIIEGLDLENNIISSVAGLTVGEEVTVQ